MGGVFSNDTSVQNLNNLTNYYNKTDIDSKGYINKSVNNLDNYYTKNYIDTKNYVTNSDLVSKNYVDNSASNLDNYYTKTVTDNKYQQKGNYIAYNSSEPNTIDFENEYATIRDKNKGTVLKYKQDGLELNKSIMFNNGIKIGNNDSYFAIDKDDTDCLTFKYTTITNNNIDVKPMMRICKNELNSVIPLISRNNSSGNLPPDFKSKFINAVDNIKYTVVTSDGSKIANIFYYDILTNNQLSINKIMDVNELNTKRLVNPINSKYIYFNINVKDMIDVLKPYISYSKFNNIGIMFTFKCTGDTNAKLKIVTSDTLMNPNVTSDQYILLKEHNGKKIDNNLVFFSDYPIIDDNRNSSAELLFQTLNYTIDDKVDIFAISAVRFMLLKNYLTFILEGTSSCSFSLFSINNENIYS